MKRNVILLCIVMFFFSVSFALAATGDLQVNCEPGVNIYIDGQYKGTTNSSDNGIFVEGLSIGSHQLKAAKSGYNEVVANININANKTTIKQIVFEGVSESVKQTGAEVEKAKAAVGKLNLRSAPYGAKMFVDGKLKGTGDIEIENIAVGKHSIVFERNNKKLSGTYSVVKDKTLKLKANFSEGKIINISESEAGNLCICQFWVNTDRKDGRFSDVKEVNVDNIRFVVSTKKEGVSVSANGQELIFQDYRDWWTDLKAQSQSRGDQNRVRNLGNKRYLIMLGNLSAGRPGNPGITSADVAIYVEAPLSVCESAGGNEAPMFPQ